METFSYSVEHASKYGFRSSIFMQILYNKIKKNECVGIKGRFWVKVSINDIRKIATYWTESQIKSIIKKCLNDKCILRKIKGNDTYYTIAKAKDFTICSEISDIIEWDEWEVEDDEEE